MDAPHCCLDNTQVAELGLKIVAMAKTQGIILRLYGGVAVALQSAKYNYLQDSQFNRRFDLDFVAYLRQITLVQCLLSEIGFQENRAVMRLFGTKRRTFFDPSRNLSADLSLDVLHFCHDIDLRGRLEHTYPSISLADLILSKLQIVQITQKDLLDLLVLLLEHDLVGEQVLASDLERIVSLTSTDWGICETAKMNLDVLKNSLSRLIKEEELRHVVILRTEAILNEINSARKSVKWKARKIVGTRLKWYNEVEDIDTNETAQ